MAAFDYLTEQGIEVGSLVFDGIMIYKDKVSPERLPQLLAGCSQRVKEVMGCDITFTNKEMDEGYDIPVERSGQATDISLLLRNGVYPYDYMDSFERLQEIRLPPWEAFYSTLNDEGVSLEDYYHARRVWKEIGITNMEEYHDLYLKTDVLLLCDVVENFRDICLKHYELDSAWYLTFPGLAYDAMLKMTGVKLELLSDPDMLLMFEKGIRGGVTVATQRYAKANNPYNEKYEPSNPTNYLMYVDANNLYGWAMSKHLPTSDFQWINPDEIPALDTLTAEDDQGYMLEVDLEYSKDLHEYHNDYPRPQKQCS